MMTGRLMNIILPGTGLISIRREWLGLSLSILFAICVNIFIAGQWIAPLAIPRWLSFTALGLAAVCWVAAQLLFESFRRAAAEVRLEIDVLIRQGRADIVEGDGASACAALEAAVALDNECVEALAACIDAYELVGRHAEAAALRNRLAPRTRWAT